MGSGAPLQHVKWRAVFPVAASTDSQTPGSRRIASSITADLMGPPLVNMASNVLGIKGSAGNRPRSSRRGCPRCLSDDGGSDGDAWRGCWAPANNVDVGHAPMVEAPRPACPPPLLNG